MSDKTIESVAPNSAIETVLSESVLSANEGFAGAITSTVNASNKTAGIITLCANAWRDAVGVEAFVALADATVEGKAAVHKFYRETELGKKLYAIRDDIQSRIDTRFEVTSEARENGKGVKKVAKKLPERYAQSCATFRKLWQRACNEVTAKHDASELLKPVIERLESDVKAAETAFLVVREDKKASIKDITEAAKVHDEAEKELAWAKEKPIEAYKKYRDETLSSAGISLKARNSIKSALRTLENATNLPKGGKKCIGALREAYMMLPGALKSDIES